MGTRSITVVKDEEGNKIIEMYKQYDGYPEGLGIELREFITSGTMVNGLGKDEAVFNGIACFAAQLIAHFKNGPGDIYLHAPTPDCCDKKKYDDMYFAEYYYEIDADLVLTCWNTYTGKEITL